VGRQRAGLVPPYSRLVGDGLWQLPDRAELFDAGGNIREGVARERDAPAGFTPDVLAMFEPEPELIEVMALRQRSLGRGMYADGSPALAYRGGIRSTLAFGRADGQIRHTAQGNFDGVHVSGKA
jgi:hypothetical protein